MCDSQRAIAQFNNINTQITFRFIILRESTLTMQIFTFIDSRRCLRRNGKSRLPIVRQVVRGFILWRGAGRQVRLEGGNDASRSRTLLRLHEIRDRIEREGSRRLPATAHRHPPPAGPEGARERRPIVGRVAETAIGDGATRPSKETRRIERRLRTAVVLA